MNRLLLVILFLVLLLGVYHFSKILRGCGCSNEKLVEGMSSGSNVTINDFFAPKTIK